MSETWRFKCIADVTPALQAFQRLESAMKDVERAEAGMTAGLRVKPPAGLDQTLKSLKALQAQAQAVNLGQLFGPVQGRISSQFSNLKNQLDPLSQLRAALVTRQENLEALKAVATPRSRGGYGAQISRIKRQIGVIDNQANNLIVDFNSQFQGQLTALAENYTGALAAKRRVASLKNRVAVGAGTEFGNAKLQANLLEAQAHYAQLIGDSFDQTALNTARARVEALNPAAARRQLAEERRRFNVSPEGVVARRNAQLDRVDILNADRGVQTRQAQQLLGRQTQLLAGYMGIGAAVGSITMTLSQVVQLDQALRNLQAITRTSQTDMAGLKSMIVEVGAHTKFTATQVAGAATVLGQAGFSTQAIKDALPAVAELATATGSTLTEAVEVATAALGAFNMRAEEMGYVSNVMTSAVNTSKLNMEKLSLGIQYAGNIAAENGASFSELTAVLAAMADRGIKSGSTLGTGVRQIFNDLADPSEKLVKKLEELGIGLDKVDLKTYGFVGVLKNLQAGGFTAADALQALDLRAANAYSALSKGVSGISLMVQQLNLSRAAAEANDIQMKGLANTLVNTGGVFVSIVDRLATDPVRVLQRLLTGFNEFREGASKASTALQLVGNVGTSVLVLSGGAWVARITGLTGAVVALRNAWVTLQGAWAVGSAVGGLTGGLASATSLLARFNPYVLGATAVLTGLIYAFGSWKDSSEAAANAVDKANSKLAEAKAKYDQTKTTLENVEQAYKEIIDRQETLTEGSEELKAAVEEARARFGSMNSQLYQNIDTVQQLTQAFQTLRQELSLQDLTDIEVLQSKLGEKTAAVKEQIRAYSEDPDKHLKDIGYRRTGWFGDLQPPTNVSKDTTALLEKLRPLLYQANMGVESPAYTVQRAEGIKEIGEFLRRGLLGDADKKALTTLQNILITRRNFSNSLQINEIQSRGLDRDRQVGETRLRLLDRPELAQLAQLNKAIGDKLNEARGNINDPTRYAAITGEVEKLFKTRDEVYTSLSGGFADVAEDIRDDAGLGEARNTGKSLSTKWNELGKDRSKSLIKFYEAKLRFIDEAIKQFPSDAPLSKSASSFYGTNATKMQEQLSFLLDGPVDLNTTDLKQLKAALIRKQEQTRRAKLVEEQRKEGTLGSPLGQTELALTDVGSAIELAKLDRDLGKQLNLKDSKTAKETLAAAKRELARLKTEYKRTGSSELADSIQTQLATIRDVGKEAFKLTHQNLSPEELAAGLAPFDADYKRDLEVFMEGAADTRNKISKSAIKRLGEDVDTLLKSYEGQELELNLEKQRSQTKTSRLDARLQGLQQGSALYPEYDTLFQVAAQKTQRELLLAQRDQMSSDLTIEQKRLSLYTEQLARVREMIAARLQDDGLAQAEAQVQATRAGTEERKIAEDRLQEIAGNRNKLMQTELDLQEKINDATGRSKALNENINLAKQTQNASLGDLLLAEIQKLTGEGTDQFLTFKQTVAKSFGETMLAMRGAAGQFFADWISGTMSAGQAFKKFANSVLNSMMSVVSNQVANTFLMLIGAGIKKLSGWDKIVSSGVPGTDPGLGSIPAATGGRVSVGGILRRAGGGPVFGGVPGKDSVPVLAMADEWVVNRKAVDEVGHQFMADLNANGADALNRVGNDINVFKPQDKTGGVVNVYVVSPDFPQQMGPNDIVAVVGDNIVRGGKLKQLVKQVQMGA